MENPFEYQEIFVLAVPGDRHLALFCADAVFRH
jgi:hypothetical protein